MLLASEGEEQQFLALSFDKINRRGLAVDKWCKFKNSTPQCYETLTKARYGM